MAKTPEEALAELRVTIAAMTRPQLESLVLRLSLLVGEQIQRDPAQEAVVSDALHAANPSTADFPRWRAIADFEDVEAEEETCH